MEWKPGDIAKCVDDDPLNNTDTPWPLRVGRTYTVIRVGIYEFQEINPTLGLEFLEIKRPFAHSAFCASRFVKQPPLIEEGEEEAAETRGKPAFVTGEGAQ